MADEAVMDAAVDTGLDTADTGDTGLDTGAEPHIEGAEPVTEPGQAEPTPDLKLIDGGKLSADAKATLDKLKVENPALAKAFQRALYKEAEYSRALPGGLKELNTIRQTVESLGGENGIQEMQQEVNGFREFDQQYTAADPKAIDFMTSDPAGQEAFVKLMPTALGKFQELHPDGFNQYMAHVIGGTLGQHGIPLALERLADFIGDNPKAMDQWNKLAGFVKMIGDLSSKQVELPKRQGAPADDRAQQLEQREATLTRTEWKNETAGEQRQVFESEWNRLAAGRKLSDAQTAAVKELFESRLNRSLNGKHAENLERYFAAKDKNGFMRYASQISKTEVPKALREAFEAVIPSKPGPKAAPAPAQKNGAPARNTPIAQGFVQIAKQPSTAEIDYKHHFNNIANFQGGKAVLKDGRKVQWTKA